MKRGERKIIKKQKKNKKLQNKIKLNIKKEKKYPYHKILNQQLTKRPHVGIHFFFFFFFFYLGFNPTLSLCIHWPSLLIVIISMSSNVVSDEKRWGAVGWWVEMDQVNAGTIPERRENNPDCSYLTWQLWQRIISLHSQLVRERGEKEERKG